MKFFVTGVGGQLGHDVMNELLKRGHEGVGSDIQENYSGVADGSAVTKAPYVALDITDKNAVEKVITEVKPDAVIHCAAWTAVDMAEDDDKVAKVRAVNAGGTQNIADVCHGVPSPKLFEDYKAALSEKYESDIQNIYFRSKILGHHLSTIAVRFSNGKLIHSRRLVKSYPRLWFAGFASRPSCYACSFKEEDRVSDFTLFDSFKSAGQYGFKDDDMGLSNVYVRTQKAIDLWKQIETQVTAVKTETAVTNKNDGDMIYESAVKNKARAEFWSDYGKLSYTELIDKYIPYSKKEAIMDKVKRVMVSTGLSKNLKIKKLLTKIKK